MSRWLHLKALALAFVGGCQPAATLPATNAPRAEPAARPATERPQEVSGLDLSGQDLSVAPGQDFYRYENGEWLASYQLKPDEKSFGTLMALHYKSEADVKAILDELAAKTYDAGTIEQQLSDYFRSYMNVQLLDELGVKALEPELRQIAGIKSVRGLIEALGKADLMGTNSPIAFGVGIDRMDPNRHMLVVAHAGLGLPDRSYYLEESFAGLRAAYTENIATLLAFTGLELDQARADAQAVVALETAIAEHHWPREKLREADKTYNKTKLAALMKQHPQFAWRPFLLAGDVDPAKVTDLNVMTPDAIGPLVQLVVKTKLASWKSYLTYHLIKSHAPLLGDAIDDAHFGFFGQQLAGQPEQRDRWKRALEVIGDIHGLGEGLGRLYVERHFSAESKRAMEALVENLRSTFRARIEQVAWMGDATRKEALDKLSAFNPKIGYPDKWRDFSAITIRPDDLMANYRAVRKYWHDDEVARLGQPTDRAEWQMTPQTVNAYYHPAFNEIVFPAAILQAPYFDLEADAAVNYGAVGAVIGHEMGHGFDDQGSKFDAKGVQRNWWSEDDRARFDALAKRVVEQYGQFEPLPGQKLNGQLTVGENIGDLGGVAIAYQAYKRALGGEPALVLAGLTGDQRFFLSWAQTWREKVRDEFTQLRLKADPHSPGAVRVNAVVRNMAAWYEAFGVKPGDGLYLPPAERVQIW